MTRRRRLTAVLLALGLIIGTSQPVAASPHEWPSTWIADSPWGAGMAIDGSGYAHILFSLQGEGADGSLLYATNKTGTWVISNTGILWTDQLQVGTDAAGNVYGTSGCGHVTNRTGTWTKRSLGSCNASSIAVDPAGEIHTAYRDGNGDLIYGTNRRGYWIYRNLGFVDVAPTVAIDGANYVHIAAGDLYITNASGIWTEQIIPFVASSVATRVVATGTSVRFMGTDGTTLQYAVHIGSGWSSTTLGPGTSMPEYVVDKAAKSHVMVENPTTHVMDYLTNASGAWARTPGVARYGYDLGVGPTGRRSFLITASGYGTVYELRYASSAPSPWSRTKVTGTTFGGIAQDLQPSIAIGSDGTAKVAYIWPPGTGPANTNAPGLRVATWTGSTWTVEYPGQADDVFADIGVDSQGHAHVAVVRGSSPYTGHELWYGTDASGSWAWSLLDSGTQLECPQVAVGPTDHPFILYRRVSGGNYPVFFLQANRTGSWAVTGPLPSQVTPAPSMPCGSIDVDTNDRVHLLYVANSILRYVNDTTTMGWYVQKTTFGGANPAALALDSNNKAHIVWETSEVRYRTNVTGAWVEALLGPSYDPIAPVIGYGANGPVLAWSSAGLTIAERPGSTWTYSAINGHQTDDYDLAVAADGHVWVVAQDPTWQPLTGLYVYRK